MQATQFAVASTLMQQLRTGNPILDMAITILIPSFCALLYKTWETHFMPFVRWVWKWLWKSPAKPEEYIVVVEYNRIMASNGAVIHKYDYYNGLLVRAIQKWVTKNVDTKEWNRPDIRVHWHGSEPGVKNRTDVRTDYDLYEINRQPPKGVWVRLTDTVKATFSTVVTDDTKQEKSPQTHTCTTITLRSKKSIADVNDFIDTCWHSFKDEAAQLVESDHKRFYYEACTDNLTSSSSLGEKKSAAATRKFRRYELSSEKTFKSLFFKNSEQVLNLLNDFKEKKNQYKVEGVLHRLTLVLHGPPGSGKTSFVKALAQYTGRSVVNIRLSQIHTTEELQTVMIAPQLDVCGIDTPVRLELKDVIYLFEDVDAEAPQVVLASKHRQHLVNTSSAFEDTPTNENKDAKKAAVTKQPKETKGTTAAASSEKKATTGAAAAAADNDDNDDARVPSKTATKSEEEDNNNNNNNKSGGDSKDNDEGEEEDNSGGSSSEDSDSDSDVPLVVRAPPFFQHNPAMMKAHMGNIAKMREQAARRNGELNLAGLLNTLDGMLDAPNRIVVFTTNCPEKLDKALTRPGRVTMKVELSYIENREAQLMIKHYMSFKDTKMTEAHISALDTILADCNTPDGQGLRCTPAVLESLCNSCSTIDALVAKLEAAHKKQNAPRPDRRKSKKSKSKKHIEEEHSS